MDDERTEICTQQFRDDYASAKLTMRLGNLIIHWSFPSIFIAAIFIGLSEQALGSHYIQLTWSLKEFSLASRGGSRNLNTSVSGIPS